MTVAQYAAYLLENFQHDMEVVRKDTGCSCCIQEGLFFPARFPSVALPVSQPNDYTQPPEPPDEENYVSQVENFVMRKHLEFPFENPKVVI